MKQLRVFFFTYGFNYKTFKYDIFRKDCKLCKLAKTSLRPWHNSIMSVCKPILKSAYIKSYKSSSPYLTINNGIITIDRSIIFLNKFI